jgi:hypothetical protein
VHHLFILVKYELKMKHYTPRKKHAEKPIVRTKSVRIDARTLIEVNADIPDDVARERFFARAKTYSHYGQGTPNLVVKEVFKEIPVGDITELAAIVDDANLSETE